MPFHVPDFTTADGVKTFKSLRELCEYQGSDICFPHRDGYRTHIKKKDFIRFFETVFTEDFIKTYMLSAKFMEFIVPWCKKNELPIWTLALGVIDLYTNGDNPYFGMPQIQTNGLTQDTRVAIFRYDTRINGYREETETHQIWVDDFKTKLTAFLNSDLEQYMAFDYYAGGLKYTMFLLINDFGIINGGSLSRSFSRSSLKKAGYSVSINRQITYPFAYQIHLKAFNKNTNIDKTSLYNKMNSSTSVIDVIPKKIVIEGEHNPTLMGVELEMSTKADIQKIIDSQTELFLIGKGDSTVRGAYLNNIELNTVPASLKSHRVLWKDFFDKLGYENVDLQIGATNGMHVHIEKSIFSPEHLTQFGWFWGQASNVPFIVAVSERVESANNAFYKFPGKQGKGVPPVKRHMTSICEQFESLGHYGAMSFSRHGTMEIRIFNGLPSYNTVMKNLEFLDSVIEFTRECTFTTNTLSNYIVWLNETPSNKYSLIKEFIKKIDSQKFYKNDVIVRKLLTLNSRNTVKFLEFLKKSDIDSSLNDYVISIINNLSTEVMFVKQEDGSYISIDKTRPVLHSLDLVKKKEEQNTPKLVSLSLWDGKKDFDE